MHGADLVQDDLNAKLESSIGSSEPRAPARRLKNLFLLAGAVCAFSAVICGGTWLLSQGNLANPTEPQMMPLPAADLQATSFAVAVATQVEVERAAAATLTDEPQRAAGMATVTHTATATPSPAPSATGTYTPTPSPTKEHTATTERTVPATPTPTPTPSSTPTALQTATPTLTDTALPSATPQPAKTPEPNPTKKPTEASAELDRYRVYFSNFTGTTMADNDNAVSYSVWSMRGDGQESVALFSEAQQPALSIDGTKLAYVHLGSGVLIYDLATGESRHVINHSSAVSPSFSPDGHRLSYAEYTVAKWWQVFSANSQVHTSNIDGSGDALALVGRRPAWSPADNLIVYEACQGTTCGLLILNANNGGTRLLVGDSAGKASWSPDGQKITYSTDSDGDSEIWSINLDGTSARRLTDNNSTDAMSAWTPDGQHIYFLSDRKDGWGIWIMNPDGTNQRRIRSIGVPRYWQWAKMAVGWSK